MAAGVPIKAPVAGISVGLVTGDNDDDFVKSYISIPILLLVISLGLIGLTACIAALVKRK